MAFIPDDAEWYLADIVLEFVVDGEPRNVVHVNIHLIKAASPAEAYEKAMKLGHASEREYENTDGKNVRCVFRGLRELNVIHDQLEDGAELAYESYSDVLPERLAKWTGPKESLGVFRERRIDKSMPNLMVESVIRMMEDAGFDRDELLENKSPQQDAE